MKPLLKSLERHGIGTRPLTEDDFWKICEIEEINVIWSAEKFSFYFTVLSKHFIVLPKRRHGLRLLFAMFHELGHYFMHSGDEPEVAFQDVCEHRHDRRETEADAVALVAIIPKHKIKEMAFLDNSRLGGKLWSERVRLHFLYGI